jgi:hypothetical protein
MTHGETNVKIDKGLVSMPLVSRLLYCGIQKNLRSVNISADLLNSGLFNATENITDYMASNCETSNEFVWVRHNIGA